MIVDRKSHSIIFDTCHDKLSLKAWCKNFDENYTKEQLVNIVSLFAERLPNYAFHMSGSLVRIKISDYLSPTKVQKAKIVDVLAAIFAEKSNRAIILDLLTNRQKTLWQNIYNDFYLSEDNCTEILGSPVARHKKNYFYNDTAKTTEEGAWLNSFYVYSYWNNLMYFYLPTFVRRAFEEFLMTSGSPGKQLVEQSLGLPAIDIDFENSTLELLPLLNGLYLSGKIETGRFRVSLTVVKRLAKQLKIQEFECVSNDDTGSYLRTMMLINAYSIHADQAMLRRNKTPLKPHTVVRGIYRTLTSNTSALNGVLLTFISKSTAKVFENCSVKGVFSLLTEKLASSKGLEPVMAEDLFDGLYTMDGRPEETTIFSRNLLMEDNIENNRTGRNIGFGNFMRQLTVPALLSSVALLASIGIIEVAYSIMPANAPHTLSGLRSVRLTPLGAYAMGLTETYFNENLKEHVYFETDNDSLMIRALEENNPYEGMMSDYCRSVGARRWLLTPETFLAGCQDENDLRKKILDFKTLTGIPLPPVYDDFFRRLEANCSWKLETDIRYALFSINPEATELLEAIVSDPEIRDIVVRAERYMILVPVSKVDQLRKCFSRYGYIL